MSVFDDLKAKAKAQEAKDVAEIESLAKKYRGYALSFVVGLILGLILPHI